MSQMFCMLEWKLIDERICISKTSEAQILKQNRTTEHTDIHLEISSFFFYNSDNQNNTKCISYIQAVR